MVIMGDAAAADRFWVRVDRKGPDDCWNWMASCGRGGYGKLKVGGRQMQAHRRSFELSGHAIPEGLQLDHLCRNRRCVNPNHLEPVNSRENTIRGNGPAGVNARKTHCKRGHPLAGANVRVIDTGRGRRGRRCVTCYLARRRSRGWK